MFIQRWGPINQKLNLLATHLLLSKSENHLKVIKENIFTLLKCLVSEMNPTRKHLFRNQSHNLRNVLHNFSQRAKAKIQSKSKGKEKLFMNEN